MTRAEAKSRSERELEPTGNPVDDPGAVAMAGLPGSGGAGGGAGMARPYGQSWVERLEAWLSRLSTKNNFWHRLFSLVWLPYAFRSGITMKRLDSSRFRAVLPFRRFNRNWYNAMAGAALLGNSEVAAGMYLFAECGSAYTVVCRNMNYRFLRPCHGPAVYEVVSSDNLREKLEAGGEFNIDLELEVRQQLKKKGKELRVGRCALTFHCTPKSHVKQRRKRKRRSTQKRLNR